MVSLEAEEQALRLKAPDDVRDTRLDAELEWADVPLLET
jgi:hypothetical protein